MTSLKQVTVFVTTFVEDGMDGIGGRFGARNIGQDRDVIVKCCRLGGGSHARENVINGARRKVIVGL
jgi:hypothetical protein